MLGSALAVDLPGSSARILRSISRALFLSCSAVASLQAARKSGCSLAW
jgi:hypothetical protein